MKLSNNTSYRSQSEKKGQNPNLSTLTKNSGECDFSEISHMINNRETEINNTSITSKNSKQQINQITDNSVISNLDNWIGNISREDSTQFEQKFLEIKNSKGNKSKTKPKKLNSKSNSLINNLNSYQKMKASSTVTSNNQGISNIQSSTKAMEEENKKDKEIKLNLGSNIYVPSTVKQNIPKKNIKLMTNKPQLVLSSIKKDEDYNDEVDEDIPEEKNQIVRGSYPSFHTELFKDQYSPHNYESGQFTNQTGYSKSFLESNSHSQKNPFKFNTCPDEELQKINYQQYNFSFTGSTKETSNISNFPNTTKSRIFPQIPDNNQNLNNPNSNKSASASNPKFFAYNQYNSNCSSTTANASLLSSTYQVSSTPKHQKFISDHNINVKLTPNNNLHKGINFKNLGSAEAFSGENEFSNLHKNLTPTNLYKNHESKFDLGSQFQQPAVVVSHENNLFRKKSQQVNVNMPFSGTPTNQAATIFSTKDKLIESKTIVAENIISGKDKRTTVMIRNIPLKYTIQNLVDELNSLFAGKFDFVNMPINLENKLNLGYAFVNFTDPFHIILFFETFQDRVWAKYKSEKKTSINYAEKQGKRDSTTKDDTMYFAVNDPKVSTKLKNVAVEIPIRYYDVFKKILPHSDIYFPKSSVKKGIPTFVLKKLF